LATVSSCSACSADRRMVIAFCPVMTSLCHRAILVVKMRGSMVSRYRSTER
jgi:hypothetical protein